MFLLINIFFVPVITLLILKRKQSIASESYYVTLLRYVCFVAFNIPLTYVIVLIIRMLCNVTINMDSVHYTVCAILAALAMVRIRGIFHSVCEIVKEHKAMKETRT